MFRSTWFRLTLIPTLAAAFGAGCLVSSEARIDLNDESTGEATGDDATEAEEDGGEAGGNSASGGDEGDGDPSTKFDVNEMPDGGDTDSECGDPDAIHAYIWVANSNQGTISKIDTQTLVEEGRYLARPGGSGSPSRTSVGTAGDVAVANRFGGVTKIWARPSRCAAPGEDEASVTTSQGANDVLDWGDDDCVAWYAPAGAVKSQRPVQWAPGEWNEDLCKYENEKVWTSRTTNDNDIEVVLLDGQTGAEEEVVAVEGIPLKSYGLYGGAVDGDGNFWGSQLGSDGYLVRVDREDFSVETWPVEIDAYGITVDSMGRVFVCRDSVARFDYQTETFAIAQTGGSGGCMTDGAGTLWQAGNPVRAVDTETLTVIDEMNVYGHGVSVDFDGYVWAIPAYQNEAHRIDPADKSFVTYDQLAGAYTYSDMTGFALEHAGSVPG